VLNVQSKFRLLPSLLDRLTDDDPVKKIITVQNEKINILEKSLIEISSKRKIENNLSVQQQEIEIKKQLNELRAHLNIMTASVSSLQDIRACVKRDLDWLLNAKQYSPQTDLEGFRDVTTSVINYGMPDLTGKTVTSFDSGVLERLLKEVILNYEPRLIRRTLNISILVDKTLFDHNALAFEIEGELWAEPQPLHLHLRTEFELENGSVKVYDYRSMEERL
jgi:type VI secretion system protein ImpF